MTLSRRQRTCPIFATKSDPQADYYAAFKALREEGIHENHLAGLLKAHFDAPIHAATAAQLAESTYCWMKSEIRIDTTNATLSIRKTEGKIEVDTKESEGAPANSKSAIRE